MNEADSLKRLLNTTTDDSTRIMLNCQISDAYADSQPDTALFYAQQGLELSQNVGFKKGQARCLTRIANVLKYTGILPKALEKHLESLKISEEINDQMGIAASYNNMAEIYKDQKDYTQALNYYIQTGSIFEKIIKDIESIKKKELIEKNKEKLIRNKSYLATTFMNIGDAYDRMKKYDSSLFFQNKALDLANQTNDINIIGAVYTNMGSVFYKLEKNDQSLINYKKAIPYLLVTEDNRFLSNAYNGIAEIFEKKGRNDSAISYARKALALVQNSSFQQEILNSLTLISRFFESLNKADSALHYNKLAKSISDSLESVEKANEVQNLKFNEQLRQQEIAEEKRLAAEERQNNLQNLAIVIFIITFFAILFIVSRRKAHPKAIESLGLLGLLLMFEFISIFLHPYIGRWTHHKPIYVLLIYVGIASLLVPLHHRLNNWVKLKLAIKHSKIAAQENKSANKSIIHKSHKAHTNRKHK
jgi:tetratricopeptide (TPR) repeat protein